MQTVANTFATLWSFEANDCINGHGSGVPITSWSQRNGGTTHIFNNAQSDALFLRLNNAPPAGAFYSGWDPNPIAACLGSAGGGAIDYTDLWWNPAESGWGPNLTQHPSGIIFGVSYTYGADGKRTWFVLPSGSWTSGNVSSGRFTPARVPRSTACSIPPRFEGPRSAGRRSRSPTQPIAPSPIP